LTRIQLAKNKKDFIDLEVPMWTLAGRPLGNNAAKQAAIQMVSSDRVQLSIDKCLTNVSANLLIRGAKNGERWNGLLLKQKREDRVIEKESFAVKKWRGDFMILTVDISGMDP
jgi:hypothetical protein